MVTASLPAEDVVMVHTDWSTYCALVAGLGEDASGVRLAYDGRTLEIMSPSADHEVVTRLLEALVRRFASEHNIELDGFGSMTLRHEPDGAEPDASFYLRRGDAVRGKARIDVSVDPAPEIVVEVDISRRRNDKRALYRRLGVLELWRYDGARLHAFDLSQDGGNELQRSTQLAGLVFAELEELLDLRWTLRQGEIERRWRERLAIRP